MFAVKLWILALLYSISLAFASDLTASPSSSSSSITQTPSGEENLISTNEHNQESKQLPKPEIRTLHIYSDIRYRYATTVVTSRVANVADKAQEVGFTVVLPETAFISDFLMVIQGKVYKAYVKGKEEAKSEYNEAVSQGRSAAHVEVSARDSNKFTVSVNVEAQGKVDFNLTYEELLTRSLGMYSHVVNLNPGQIVKNMSVTVTINESSNITKIQVPDLKTSNEITLDQESKNKLATIERHGGQSAVIHWDADPTQQKEIAADGVNGQLIVKYDVERETNPQQILVDEGYFVHFFAPDTLPALRKHVIFVLDHSGSMLGRKLEQLRDAMKVILSDLNSSDYFSLVLFSDRSAAWSPNRNLTRQDYYNNEIPLVSKDNVVSASPVNIKLAIDFLHSFNDLGLTNIISGLRDGLKLADIGKDVLQNTTEVPEPIIIFLTDGQPNVEISKPHLIVREVQRLNTKRVAVFSLAFGDGADIKFLKKLSLSNNGFVRKIYEAADASLQLKNLYKHIASPLLSNVTFSYLPGQVDNETSSRTQFPLLFGGSELVVVGRLLHSDENQEQNETINGGELTAKSSTGLRTFNILFKPFRPFRPFRPVPVHPRPTINPPTVFPDHLPPAENKPGDLEKVWAYLTIKQLLDNTAIQQGDELNATKQKALDMAIKYSFVTPLTSLVVVKPNTTSSAIDTEMVKPGVNMDKILGSSNRAAFYPASHSRMLINARSSNRAAFYPASHSRMLINAPTRRFHIAHEAPRSLVPHPNYGFLPTLRVTSSAAPPTVEKLDLHEVIWLFNYTSADNTTIELPLADKGKTQFKLGLNETDVSFGSCITPMNTSGECHHFQHCILRGFINRLEEFLPYRCDISSGYLGTCCPLL